MTGEVEEFHAAFERADDATACERSRPGSRVHLVAWRPTPKTFKGLWVVTVAASEARRRELVRLYGP